VLFRRALYQTFFQKVLEERPPYASLAPPSGASFLTGGGVGPGSVPAAGTDSGAGEGACAEAVKGAGPGTLRSVLAGLSKSSNRPPLKRSKSSSWEGPVVIDAAAEDHMLEAP
jgi:hypothetical protein